MRQYMLALLCEKIKQYQHFKMLLLILYLKFFQSIHNILLFAQLQILLYMYITISLIKGK